MLLRHRELLFRLVVEQRGNLGEHCGAIRRCDPLLVHPLKRALQRDRAAAAGLALRDLLLLRRRGRYLRRDGLLLLGRLIGHRLERG